MATQSAKPQSEKAAPEANGKPKRATAVPMDLSDVGAEQAALPQIEATRTRAKQPNPLAALVLDAVKAGYASRKLSKPVPAASVKWVVGLLYRAAKDGNDGKPFGMKVRKTDNGDGTFMIYFQPQRELKQTKQNGE